MNAAPKKPKKADADRKHPFGDDRAARIERWRAISIFGNGDLAAVAKLVLEADKKPAEARGETARGAAALFALGLHGPRKTGDNRRELREALDELCRIVDVVYPPADPFDDDDYTTAVPPPPGLVPPPAKYDAEEAARELEAAGNAARARLDDVLDRGVAAWLFERAFVSADPDADSDSKVRQLRRLTQGEPEVRRLLQWALGVEKHDRPPKLHGRGRVQR